MRDRPRLLYITTVAATQVSLLRGQNPFMQGRGFDLHGIATPGEDLARLAARDGVQVHPVTISRTMSPLRDLVSLVHLCREIRRIRPDIVHYSTPKGALLGAIAACLCRVPARLFVFRGSITENARGRRRWLFRGLERLTASLSHEVVCVSPSLLAFAKAEGILDSARGVVVGSGMSNGIDVGRFDPEAAPPVDDPMVARALAWRAEAPNPRIIGFIGRLAHDKGIADLAQAWRRVAAEAPDARLLLVGPWEEEHQVAPAVREALEGDPRVFRTGAVADVVPYYRLMDVFCLPSHREGFPNAPMEAAAMRLPVVVTAVSGCIDAVVAGTTGALVPPQAPDALAEALLTYVRDPALARLHGDAGRARVAAEFQPHQIWEGLFALYQGLLQKPR